MIELKQHNIKPYAELCVTLSKHNKCAYISATGTGKSYVAAKYVDDYHKQDKCIVIVPSLAIGNNWKRLLPDIHVITYQKGCRIKNFVSDYLDDKSLIILDEFHHVGAEKWGKPFFDILNNFSGRIIGLSATPIRYLDNYRNMIDEFFNTTSVHGLMLSEAINEGILPSFQYVTALYDLPSIIDTYRKKTSNDSTEKLIHQLDILGSEYSFNRILSKYLSNKKSFKIIVFVDSVDSIEDVHLLLENLNMDFDIYTVSWKHHKAMNKASLNKFKDSYRSSFLLCVNMINEGIHIKETTGIIMFRRTQSPTIYLQQIGRALSSDSIEKPIIFDFVANHSNLKAYKSMQDNTIHRINSEITNLDRQIIISDYAMEEEILLAKLNGIINCNLSWSDEELEILREKYSSCTIYELMKLLPNRTPEAIRFRASVEGVTHKKMTGVEFLEDVKKYYYDDNGIEILLAKYPNTTKHRIQNFAQRNGITKNNKWSDEELKIIRDNNNKLAKDIMYLLPNRSRRAIQIKMDQLNCPSDPVSYSEWDEEKIQRFAILYINSGYPGIRNSDEFSGMTKRDINKCTQKFKLSRNGKIANGWSEEELSVINEYIGSDSNISVMQFSAQFAERFPNRTKDTVRHKVRKMMQEQKEDV